MSPQLILLLLQEISQLAPGLIADFQQGNITPEQQQALFDAVTNLSDSFKGPEWQKSTDVPAAPTNLIPLSSMTGRAGTVPPARGF